ncbi:MAG TPA: hypothetical protein DEP91_04380 [Sphingomonas bacterium]|jgi:hypothetical protein|uniref:Uncharacterized protein n=1 Tax=Sphingomonas bacterium TaxID=1895847 RepID=A0A3D0WA30_9SPHN|nr:hypothetical protein [Sphingomonas bacterium]
MADGVDLAFEDSAFTQAGDRIVRDYLTAGTRAVGGATRQLEKRLEDATRAGVPGKLWRAWQSTAYPKDGPAKNPAGTVWLRGGARTRGAFQFWTRPGAVKGKSGQFLAIPTAAAGNRGRGRDLTPGEWEQRTGVRLRFVYRRGRASLLVADRGTVQTARGTYTAFKPLTGKRQAADARRGFSRREATAIIFVLLPMVKHRNSVAVEPIINASDGELAALFFREVAALRGGRA